MAISWAFLKFSSQHCKNRTVEQKSCSNAPPMRQKKNGVLLREAASHMSLCNKCDLKWGPLKVYSSCLFLKRSFYSTAFLPCVSLQCIVSKHGIRTASDCLHCVISQKLLFSYVFCIKVTLTHDTNSSNISHLRTVVLSALITSILKNMLILCILFELLLRYVADM